MTMPADSESDLDPEHNQYWELTNSRGDAVGVFRYHSGEDGDQAEHYFRGVWKPDSSLLAYIYWGETGAHAIDLDRARELIAWHDRGNKAWDDRHGVSG